MRLIGNGGQHDVIIDDDRRLIRTLALAGKAHLVNLVELPRLDRQRVAVARRRYKPRQAVRSTSSNLLLRHKAGDCIAGQYLDSRYHRRCAHRYSQ